MKTSLTHLPPEKQADLKKIVAVIQKECTDIEMIILFGSYATGKYKEAKDLKPQRWSGHVSDYDILVITKNQETANKLETWHNINDLLLEEKFKHNLTACPRIIAHDIHDLNASLRVNHYFFGDIKKEGILLFDSGNFELSEAEELSPQEKQAIARGYFNDKFGTAKGFYKIFELVFKQAQSLEKDPNNVLECQQTFKLSSFQLHQAAEHAYKAILLVFTNYCPDEHFLSNLSYEARESVPEISKLFQSLSKQGSKRFRLLDKAYIGARYIESTKPFKASPMICFDIYKEDLEYLAPEVKKLLEITKRECEKKIESLGK